MIQGSFHTVYTTFRKNTKVMVNLNSISHIIDDEDHGGCWIWFENAKSIHVVENFDDVCLDFQTFLDN